METHLPILILLLDSWCRNESGSVLRSWFWIPIGPARKTRQALNVNFIDCLEKCDFFAKIFKHKQIIYYWKAFFVASMNSRSLPRNKDPLRSDPLTKFAFFAQKCVPTIWALLFGTKGTILTRRLRWTCWDPKTTAKVARGCEATPRSGDFLTPCHRHQWRHLNRGELGPTTLASFEAVWKACVVVGGRLQMVSKREKEEPREKERRYGEERERGSGWEREMREGEGDSRGTFIVHWRRHKKTNGKGSHWQKGDEKIERSRQWVLAHIEVPYWGLSIFFFLREVKSPFCPSFLRGETLYAL